MQICVHVWARQPSIYIHIPVTCKQYMGYTCSAYLQAYICVKNLVDVSVSRLHISLCVSA